MVGFVPAPTQGRDTSPIAYASGRALTAADEGRDVVGPGRRPRPQAAATIGGTDPIRDADFKVVGILEPTLTVPDSQAFMPLAAAQRLYVKDLPAEIADQLVPRETITHIVVYPRPARTSERARNATRSHIAQGHDVTAREFDQTIGSMANLLSGIIVGVGFISLIVGGLSVVNTMAMSVNERTREIGIKRAIGGSRRRIILELVSEAGLIGFIGGRHRACPRRLVVVARQRGRRSTGTILFSLTASTAVSAARLRDRPRDGRRDRARDPRGAARSRPGPSTRIGAIDMALLEARNLHKTFHLGRDNTVEALRGVDVTIEAGEMVAIMGPSGSGKSTLMHILGLLQQPDLTGAGSSLLIGGRDVTHLSDGARTRIRAHELGFVFQSYNLVPTLTAVENVALAAGYAGRGGSAGRAAALEALELVGLADRARHRPSELSGGEQQRVAIARALVNLPRLVLADEPTGNLDSAKTAEVLALLRRFNRERGQTFVIVTHDPEVGAACDRIIRMRDGLVVGSELALAA